jgi:hypothetical protein
MTTTTTTTMIAAITDPPERDFKGRDLERGTETTLEIFNYNLLDAEGNVIELRAWPK